MKLRNISIVFVLSLFGVAACYKNEPVPTADFTYAGSNEFRVPCTVMFTNQSVNAFSYEWRFGDDSISTLESPKHLYNKPGKYDVYLRAYTESRNEWASIIRVVTIRDTLNQ
jgi:PKD repeat protein